MARSRRSLHKNQQELKRLKTVTLLKANVHRDRIMGIVDISEYTFFLIKNDFKRRRSRRILYYKNDKLRIYNNVARNPFISLRYCRSL